MDNSLDKFGKQDAGWLKENGFQMVPRGWAESEEGADYYYWTVYKKLSKNLEIRLQYNYREDAWSGWPIFSEVLTQLLVLSSDNCPDAETAFEKTMKKVNQILDAVAAVKTSLEEDRLEKEK